MASSASGGSSVRLSSLHSPATLAAAGRSAEGKPKLCTGRKATAGSQPLVQVTRATSRCSSPLRGDGIQDIPCPVGPNKRTLLMTASKNSTSCASPLNPPLEGISAWVILLI